MSVRQRQRQRLTQTTTWAQKIRDHLQGVLNTNKGRVHFRPSSGGVAMVGLTPERPQRGKSGIRNLAKLAEDFDAEFRKRCVDIEQGRPTAEKSLQSWVIAEAYRNNRRMVSLLRAPEATASVAHLVFVTDELAIPITADGKSRIVCDILALREDRGVVVPVAIELKTRRQLTRLVEQVTDYAALVDQHTDLFAELYSVILGRNVSFTGPCEKWVVWPIEGALRDGREDELAEVGVRIVGYEKAGDGYHFRVGRDPSSKA